jgi:cob(I)alamin adenosyltransferase
MFDSNPKHGQIMVFHGDGRGKTSAAMGEVLFAVSSGQRVCVVFFMKGKRRGAEYKSLEDLQIEYEVFGRSGFLGKDDAEQEDKSLAQKALDYAIRQIVSNKFDLIVLDEIINAQYYGLIDVEDTLNLMSSRPLGVSLLLTGKTVDTRILERADKVCEFQKIKHPYDRGIFARKGIDF